MNGILFVIGVIITGAVVFGPYTYIWARFMVRHDGKAFLPSVGASIASIAINIGLWTVIGQIDPPRAMTWTEIYLFLGVLAPIMGISAGLLAGMAITLYQMGKSPLGCLGIDIEAEKRAAAERIERRRSNLAVFMMETKMKRLQNAVEWQKTVDRYGMRALESAPHVDTPEEVLADIRAYMEENWALIQGRREEIFAIRQRVLGDGGGGW